MRLKTGVTWAARRDAATSSSDLPDSSARRASEKPICFSFSQPSLSVGSPPLRIACSRSTMALICSRNHGSYLETCCTSAMVKPWRKACAMTSSRSGVGRASAPRMAAASGVSVSPMRTSLKPVRPVSMERSAFWTDSWKVRPMDMASPTDFMEVVSSGSVPANFSKVKRGIFVTT